MKKRSRKIVKKLTSLMLCIAYFTVILCGSVYMNSINSVNAATEDSGVVDFCAVQTDEDGAGLSETPLATGNDAISDDEISDEDQSTGEDSGEENLATPGDSEMTADKENSVDINNATYDKTDFEQYMKSQGFNIYCNVDSSQYFVQIGDQYLRMGRRNLDGYRMYYNPEQLEDLFDVSEVWDDSRPTPVQPMS